MHIEIKLTKWNCHIYGVVGFWYHIFYHKWHPVPQRLWILHLYFVILIWWKTIKITFENIAEFLILYYFLYVLYLLILVVITLDWDIIYGTIIMNLELIMSMILYVADNIICGSFNPYLFIMCIMLNDLLFLIYIIEFLK